MSWDDRISGLLRACLVLLLVAGLVGCGMFGKKKPPPTEMEIKPAPAAAGIDFIAEASPLINPLPDGEPSPVVLRLYQLKGDAAFANASFRQLWEEDEKTLGPTLLGKAEIVLNPGGVQRIKANLIEGTVLVAVVVGFRSFETAKWRAMVPLHGEKSLKLKAELKTLSVTLGPQD
jgi:type VI secretion system protein VasD